MTTRMVFLAAGLVWSIAAQSQPSLPPAFEVVSIKPNPKRTIPSPISGRPLGGVVRAYLGPMPIELRGISGDRFEEMAATVADLIADAYRIRPTQVFGLPKWAGLDGEAYDLQAKIPGGKTAPSDDVRWMLQAALSSRFKLKIHRENRVMPVYELSIMKSGMKMKAAPPGTTRNASENANGVSIMDLPTLVRRIEQFLDRPLSDKTGLNGYFENRWNQDELLKERRAMGSQALAPSVFTTVKEQLGLELKATRTPLEVIVVDSVERPSLN